jgi:transportin-3
MQEDKLAIYESIGWIISSMPMEMAATALRKFVIDIFANIQNAPAAGHTQTIKGRQQFLWFHYLLTPVLEALEQLEQLLDVVGSFGEELPAACQNTAADMWAVMDGVIKRYGDLPEICDRATRALRLGLQFFDRAALPLVPAILACLTSRFENTGFASYLWSIGKVIQRFGSEEDPVIRSAMQETYERCSVKCWEIFSQSAITLHSDG